MYKIQGHENNSQFDLTSLNRDITIEETEAALHTLKKGKAAGPDLAFLDLLRNSGPEMTKAIHLIFKTSFINSEIPIDWKDANVKFPLQHRNILNACYCNLETMHSRIVNV